MTPENRDTDSPFSEKLATRIKVGKYTRWASDLKEADLYALIYFVGEFACRSGGGEQFAVEQWPRHYEAGFSLRQDVALGVLCQIYKGRRFEDTSIQSIREALYAGWRQRDWNGGIIEVEE